MHIVFCVVGWAISKAITYWAGFIDAASAFNSVTSVAAFSVLVAVTQR